MYTFCMQSKREKGKIKRKKERRKERKNDKQKRMVSLEYVLRPNLLRSLQ